MEKKEVVIEKSVVVKDTTVVAVAEVVLKYSGGHNGVFLYAIKRPIYTVVFSPSSRQGFMATGENVPIERVIEEFPGIEAMIG